MSDIMLTYKPKVESLHKCIRCNNELLHCEAGNTDKIEWMYVICPICGNLVHRQLPIGYEKKGYIVELVVNSWNNQNKLDPINEEPWVNSGVSK